MTGPNTIRPIIQRLIGRISGANGGNAGAELALILPLLLVLLFAGLEAGNFIWTQHKLVEAVRDGARYASRLDLADFCPAFAPAVQDRIKLITRTGQLADAAARPVVPGWTADMVTVTVTCDAFVKTGIYADMSDGTKGPIVVVAAANVPYSSLFHVLGAIEPDRTRPVLMGARSSAAVIGL
ncbi:TadE/TadG family type IV pilus assembly protein [Novosphingobium bradum]|uniref:TadE/TadG family type IV pilus assembly protein n=1 Tax=Novosphingobium bradum TaxID=1737444 RepID=A0ABV7IN52_9SPHN